MDVLRNRQEEEDSSEASMESLDKILAELSNNS